MDRNKICEALYALPGDVVVKHRKSLFAPLAMIAIGAAMLVLNNLYRDALTVNLSSSLVFIGGVVALGGIVLAAARLFSSTGVPYNRRAKSALHYDELYFERDTRGEVMRCIECGDIDHLLAMPHASVPAVAVALYRTRDNRFAAMQAYEYAELEYRPLTELKIVGE